MRILYLESESWRSTAFSEAFRDTAGQAVEVAVSTSLGEFARDLQSPFEAAFLPPRVPLSEEHRNTSKLDELLAWYLSRQIPELGLWRYKQGDEVDSDTVHLGKQIEIGYLEYPDEAQGYLNWVRNFCRKKKIRYVAPAKPLSWWSERQWLIVSNEAGYRDSYSLEEQEVVSDLASFFALKATQFQHCLGSDGWLSWEFPAEVGATQIRPAGDDHTLYVREGPTEGSLSKETILFLQELGVAAPDA